MRRLVQSGLCCIVSVVLGACAAPKGESKAVPEALEQYVLEKRPKEIEHEHFIDFGGKVHLLGYDADPDGQIDPGGTLKMTFYWKSVDDLGPGWGLFTHLHNARGERITPPPPPGDDRTTPYDDRGPLRARSPRQADQPLEPQAFPPSRWVPGNFYVDEQTLPLPSAAQAPLTSRITVLVGVWNGTMRLQVLSGPAVDEAGIVAHFETGIETPAPQSPKTASKTP